MGLAEFDISETFAAQKTDRALIDEATRPASIPSGDYKGTVVKATGRVAGDKSPFPGRKMINLQVNLYGAEGKKVKTEFVEVSPEERRVMIVAGKRVSVAPENEHYSKELELDGPSKMWLALCKIVDERSTYTVPEVVSMTVDNSFKFNLREAFVDENKQYHNPKSAEERRGFFAAGYVGKNFVNAIKKVG